MSDFLIKAYQCTVTRYPNVVTVYAASRGKAMSKLLKLVSVAEDDLTFKALLKRARVVRCGEPEGFGESILVGGAPAFFVGVAGDHVRFVRPGSDTILLSHPLDVQGAP